jgi:hypothetical protein
VSDEEEPVQLQPCDAMAYVVSGGWEAKYAFRFREALQAVPGKPHVEICELLEANDCMTSGGYGLGATSGCASSLGFCSSLDENGNYIIGFDASSEYSSPYQSSMLYGKRRTCDKTTPVSRMTYAQLRDAVEFREDKEQRKEWKKKWNEGHQKGMRQSLLRPWGRVQRFDAGAQAEYEILKMGKAGSSMAVPAGGLMISTCLLHFRPENIQKLRCEILQDNRLAH